MDLGALITLSSVLKILVVFALILVGTRLRLHLGLGLISGGLLIDLWAGKGTGAVLADLVPILQQPELWLLLLNITLILEFGYFMADSRQSDTILAAARRLGGRHGRALSLVMIPALIGLVPMPGGALFSAPLVGEAVRDQPVVPAWKAAVNYWFRHVLEYWWPLYPVVIVSLSIFTLPIWQFFLLQVPFTAVSLAAGWYFLLRPHLGELMADTTAGGAGGSGQLLAVLLPIFLIVGCTVLLPPLVGTVLPAASPTLRKLLAMLAGLLASLSWIRLQGRHRGVRLFQQLFTAKTADVVITLGGVMVFKGMLEASGVLPAAGQELQQSAIPVEMIIAFLPFLAGLVTGVAIGFGGPAFPLVVGLAATHPGISQGAALVLAFAMGYGGMMLSPVHLCYILTRRYFTVELGPTYPYLLPCVLLVMGWGVVFHLGLRLVGW